MEINTAVYFEYGLKQANKQTNLRSTAAQEY